MKIVVRQLSGLGNQLFQYAAGLYYAARYNAQLRLAVDLPRTAVSHGYARPFLLSHFCISAPAETVTPADRFVFTEVHRSSLKPLSRMARSAAGIQIFTEPTERRYTFIPDLLLEKGTRTLYLVGYWQTFPMVNAISDKLREEFRFREPARGKNEEVLDSIAGSRHSISIHMRRGDYTLSAEGNIALPMEYYERAISRFREQMDDPTFYVFSDDIAYSREHLPKDIRAVFVDHNDAFSSHEDLRLMSSCQHHIIANSTFSWWGAWLNSSTHKIVVAPRQWLLTPESYFPELLPPEWTLADVL